MGSLVQERIGAEMVQPVIVAHGISVLTWT
jgi:hypothetical protein